MCSIFGIYNPIKKQINSNILNNIIKNSINRGQDAFGMSVVNFEGEAKLIQSFEMPENLDFTSDIYSLIGNYRAEPTTEYIERKNINDIQPYQFGETSIVHNGTIANDRELNIEYGITPPTDIDSYCISYVLENSVWDVKNLKESLIEKLIGSYALLAINGTKYLAASNYKPLYLLICDEVYYFASLPEYFGVDVKNLNSYYNIVEIGPYEAILFDPPFLKTRFSLYKESQQRKKAVICASSGLDSTVAAKWAQDQGYDVELLHFNYECKATENEFSSIKSIAEKLNVKLNIIDTKFFKNVIGGSTLYTGDSEINTNGKDGAELALEWVPARNLVFLSIASAFAEAKGIDYVVLGGNLEESGAYADNEYIFQKKFNDLLPNALNLQHRVQLLTPLANLMKRDIVRMGLENGAPLDLTWSCYLNGEKHCGKCGPCFMRRTAFKMLNEPEVIQYES